MKNVKETEKGFFFNLGIRKPVLNAKELLSHPAWEKLINKWVVMIDEYEGEKIFIKHVFHHQRVIQVIYSGKDIFGDGVYTLYKVNINLNNNDCCLDPEEYSIEYGSFDFETFEDYLDKVIEDGYITEAEKEILLDEKKRNEFAKGLYVMKNV